MSKKKFKDSLSKKYLKRTKELVTAYQSAEGGERVGIEKQLKQRLGPLTKRRLRDSATSRQPGVIKPARQKKVGGSTTVHRTHKKRFKGKAQ